MESGKQENIYTGLLKLGAKLPSIIDGGKEIIYPQRYAPWEKRIWDFAKSELLAMEFVYNDDVRQHHCVRVYETLTLLDDGKFEEAHEILRSWPFYQIADVIMFSKRGPEYARRYCKLDKKGEKFVAEIEAQNAQFEQELNPESGDDE